MSQTQPRGQRFRVRGSGYTVFSYNGSVLKFCETIRDTAPRPVADPVAVQPMDARHPIEIAFPRAAGIGTLVASITEEFSRDVWRQFPGYRNGVINDIVDVFERSARIGGVTAVKLILPPRGSRRAVFYHNAVITDIDQSEDINIASMTVGRTVTITYTHRTSKGG